jgi:multiple sugar transport system ATP-binding protein
VVGSGDGTARRAAVEIVEPMGAETLVWCRVDGELMSVRLDGETTTRVGETMQVGFPADRLNLFDAASGARL